MNDTYSEEKFKIYLAKRIEETSHINNDIN